MSERDPWAEDLIDKPPEGISGWLLVPLLQLIAIPIFLVLAALKHMKAPVANFHALLSDPFFLALAVVVTMAMLAQFGLGLYCLFKFFRKRAELPHLMAIWYGIGIALSALVAVQFALDQELFAKVVDASLTSGRLGTQSTLNIAVFGFFIVYFRVSKRVKNTFIR